MSKVKVGDVATLEGVSYIAKDALPRELCKGCAFEHDSNSDRCVAIHLHYCDGIIWVEDTVQEIPV